MDIKKSRRKKMRGGVIDDLYFKRTVRCAGGGNKKGIMEISNGGGRGGEGNGSGAGPQWSQGRRLSYRKKKKREWANEEFRGEGRKKKTYKRLSLYVGPFPVAQKGVFPSFGTHSAVNSRRKESPSARSADDFRVAVGSLRKRLPPRSQEKIRHYVRSLTIAGGGPQHSYSRVRYMQRPIRKDRCGARREPLGEP